MSIGKKRMPHIAVLTALMAIALLPQTMAYFYTVYTECSTVPCISGQSMNWTLEISNDGMHRLEYASAEIVDSTTDKTMAIWDSNFNPLSSERGDTILVNPTRKKNITLSTFVPKGHFNNQFFYYSCYTHIISDTQTLSKYGEYTFRHCYKENESLFVLGCTASDHCKVNEICGGNECKELECGPCEYVKDHACIKYGCCVDDDCSYDSQCANNTCVKIPCLESQYLFNRTCVDIQCEESEIILNHSCIPLECLETEGYSNHSCIPLSCGDDEHIVDHYCEKLDCLGSEYPSNHTCNSLGCSNEQGYRNHQCYDLECYPFQTMNDHNCKNNLRIIVKLSIEVLIVLLIIAFIALDIYKYRHRGGLKVGTKRTSLKEGLQSSSSGSGSKSLGEELIQFKSK